ncbi:DUF1652 domain-containing protein [Pseudomonas gingeri]|uniref:DUF1652 domain-containing protein n=1 Tax=Pseudomonas gingeri TaxID=117681 RepID=A0A7Y7Y8G8_9PSED|nr:DUF1652 domain-containing protein [Pseudomonas gingeri]NWA16838.1 DUF1652 domain-containing protein [Pseudomonas gingeri]NWA53776.1 DUF1652 domain-containing protein [Pseudomonas gingeri]NWA94008.1 DUF1652 domain-containing protein [Pseudomonas gingeri]NWB02092.1 DUF1652 domain-containing protein [Pseudomonas gingeri]
MISILELRNIIELGFLPLRCQCTVGPDSSLTVKVFDSQTGKVDLLVTGISSRALTSARAISNLMGQLRSELSANQALSGRRMAG